MEIIEKHLLLLAITTMRDIGRKQYSGDVYTNVSAIFAELTAEQREIILKEFTLLYYINHDTNIDDNTHNDVAFPLVEPIVATTAVPTSVTWEERRNPEIYSRNELIRLRSFAVKCVLFLLIAGILITIGLIIFMPSSSSSLVSAPNEKVSALTYVFEILKLMVGFD